MLACILEVVVLKSSEADETCELQEELLSVILNLADVQISLCYKSEQEMGKPVPVS